MKDARSHYNNDGMDPDWKPPETLPASLHELDRLAYRVLQGDGLSAADRSLIARTLTAAARDAQAPRLGYYQTVSPGWKQQDADMLAASVDAAIRRGALDPRSEIADCRLDYGNPFPPDEVAEHLSKRRHGKNSTYRTGEK